MLIAAALLTVIAAVTVASPRLLVGAPFTRRSPTIGIVVWQASLLTVLSSLVLLAVTALLPVHGVSFDLGHLLHACPEALRSLTLLDDSALHVLGLAVSGTALSLLVMALALTGRSVHRVRARQRQALDLIARPSPHHAAQVVDYPAPMAYCVPGSGGRVVLTSAALSALDERQLRAVLAHEHAHLDGRHDLVLLGADVAVRAFPGVSFFRLAQQELVVLVEMLADDVAARRCDRRSLVEAIVRLSQAPAPSGALGRSGHSLLRVQRLLAGLPSLTRPARTLACLSTIALATLPYLVALAPAWASPAGLCPVS